MIYLFLGALFFISLYMLANRNGRAKDSEAMFWSTIAEPLIYRTQDIDDDGAMMRAENARQKLKEHGNLYLKATDVHCFLWGADHEEPTLDFQRWADMADRRATSIREAYRKEKARRNPAAAAELLAGQRIHDFDDIRERE